VKLKKVLRSKSKYYLVMECVAGGSLIDYILKHGRLDEDRARRYLQHIVAGVEYCHAHHIYHRDLKPDNVLLTEDLLTAKVCTYSLTP
jgi:carbon catabolite-derepressing protein kinase